MMDDWDEPPEVPAWKAVAIVAGIIGVMMVMAFWANAAFSHDKAAMSDPKRGAWFSSLTQPNGTSCCNLTDCEQTQARQKLDGSWEAVLNDYKGARWIDVPPEKVIKRPLSIDGEAYLCHSQGMPAGLQYEPSLHKSYSAPAFEATVYCFVPPIPGY